MAVDLSLLDTWVEIYYFGHVFSLLEEKITTEVNQGTFKSHKILSPKKGRAVRSVGMQGCLSMGSGFHPPLCTIPYALGLLLGSCF